MNKTKEKPMEIINVGKPDINAMSKQEQRTFYGQLLTRLIKLRKEQLEKTEKQN